MAVHAVKMGKYWRVSEENLKAFIETGTPVLDENRRKENRAIIVQLPIAYISRS